MKICAVTGTRAEYGIIKWILQYINEDPNLELQLIATGMHLSPEFGLTHELITQDGFNITKKIEILLSSDTPVGISKSMGLGMISYADSFSELKPNLLLIVGDRFEIFAAASAAMIARIPIAHIHGGESTEGLIDESIRHSITKMSHLHFTSTDYYKKRIIQLGEHPSRVFNFGAPGLDNIKKLQLKNKNEIFKILELEENDKFFLITFHPVTLENNKSKDFINILIKSLIEFDQYKLIFTLPNADTEGRIIAKRIKEFITEFPSRGKYFKSLGQINYLSAMREASLIIGNSSSGIIEAPSFKIPTINIGIRQKGRIKSDSVIDCRTNKDEILKAIKQGISVEFRKKLISTDNPYGTGESSKKIVDKIKNIDLKNIIYKKFYNT